jgi:SAM-dependent methyltransferase
MPTGLVEVFTQREATGWVAAPPHAKPIRVSLHVDELEVTAGWATTARSDRTAFGEARSFRLRFSDVWKYAGPKNKLTVRANGTPLPIAGAGMYLVPEKPRQRSLKRLRAEMSEGYVFGQTGRLQLSKTVDTEWQEMVLNLYDGVRQVLYEVHGYDLFLIFGSLLGAVRDGGVIGHDLDFDSAYVSKHTDGRDAARELRDIALLLLERGYDVDLKQTVLHVHPIGDQSFRIDVFHLYFDAAGRLAVPWGVAGNTEVMLSDWKGTKEIDFLGSRVLVPSNDTQVVEHLYGSGWRSPQPGFMWTRDRTKRAWEGIIPPSYAQTVYWANFYARTGVATGSTFFERVNGWPDIPGHIIDIGCGDGRDSHAFADAGRSVLGLDRSAIGVQHALDKAQELGIADRVRFEVCDVAVADDASAVLASATADPAVPVVFYLRFFLHSVPEDVQETLMQTIADLARPGDMLAAEFRTDKDEARSKTFRGHYRRFQSGPGFGHALHERYGFDVLDEQEGTGLSVYKDEDPELYRVIARR